MLGKLKWPFHPKHFAIVLAVVFFASLSLLSFAASSLPQLPSWYLTATAILSVLGGSCFTAWLSMSIYEFITREGQDRGYKTEFAVDLVKTLYGPLYDEMMRALDRLLFNYDLLGLDHLESLHWKYLRLLVPNALIDNAKGLEAMAAMYRKVLANADQILNRKGAQIAKAFVKQRGGTLSLTQHSGDEDTLYGGEWRAVLGTGDSGMKSNLDRLALAVSRAVATTSGKEDPDVIGKFQQEFVEAIRTDVYAEGIKEKRDTLAAFIKSQVIGELEPLIQTPYLGRNSATRLASMPARVPASSGRPGPGDPPKERDGQGKGPGHKARHDGDTTTDEGSLPQRESVPP